MTIGQNYNFPFKDYEKLIDTMSTYGYLLKTGPRLWRVLASALDATSPARRSRRTDES